jgi:hypothetical protein
MRSERKLNFGLEIAESLNSLENLSYEKGSIHDRKCVSILEKYIGMLQNQLYRKEKYIEKMFNEEDK